MVPTGFPAAPPPKTLNPEPPEPGQRPNAHQTCSTMTLSNYSLIWSFITEAAFT